MNKNTSASEITLNCPASSNNVLKMETFSSVTFYLKMTKDFIFVQFSSNQEKHSRFQNTRN